jgi:hypothetical protein
MDRLRARTKIMALIAEEDYPLFLKTLSLDVRLPPRYAEWHAQFAAEDHAHRAAGMNTRHVLVRHRELVGFLKRIQLRPTYEALQTYAAYVSRSEIGQRNPRGP